MSLPSSVHLEPSTHELTSGQGESPREIQTCNPTPWWPFMGQGLLDVKWLEDWILQEGELFGDTVLSSLSPPNYDDDGEIQNVSWSVNLSRHVTHLAPG